MSWSGIQKRLEKEFLAEKLRGRVEYHCPAYEKRPDEHTVVTLDGRELLPGKFFTFDRLAVANIHRALYKAGGLTRPEMWSRTMITALEKGILDSSIVFFTAHTFVNSPIEASLFGENPLARMYALLDRRTGKRRLKQLAAELNEEPEWLQQFYLIRLQAENITL